MCEDRGAVESKYRRLVPSRGVSRDPGTDISSLFGSVSALLSRITLKLLVSLPNKQLDFLDEFRDEKLQKRLYKVSAEETSNKAYYSRIIGRVLADQDSSSEQTFRAFRAHRYCPPPITRPTRLH
jgi:hypothetical protein